MALVFWLIFRPRLALCLVDLHRNEHNSCIDQDGTETSYDRFRENSAPSLVIIECEFKSGAVCEKEDPAEE